MTIRDISRQSQTVPQEYPDEKDHRRQIVRALNPLIASAALHPTDIPTTISSTYTMVDSDRMLLAKTDGGVLTVFLLPAAGREGRALTVKHITSGNNAVTIDGNSSETIDGATTATIAGQNAALSLISDGSNWKVAGDCQGTGSFTATLTGCTTSPTGSVNYAVTGKTVTLTIPSISGTSNTTAATLTGLPAAITPATNQFTFCNVFDTGANFTGLARVDAAGIITLFKDDAFGVFTNSGVKGIQGVHILHYTLF